MMRAYRRGDWQFVKPQKQQAAEAAQFARCFDEINAYSLCDDKGKIYGIFGWRLIDETSGECFALLDENCRSKLLEIIRFFKCEIPCVMQRHRIEKAFMTVKKSFLPAERMAHLLGFYKAADLPLFFLGSDYQLFERKNECLQN